MRRLAGTVLAVCGLSLAALAPAPASATSTAINTNFAAATATETTGGLFGPSFNQWDFSTVTLGPSPALRSLHITYCIGEGCAQYFTSFTLTDLGGNSVSGSATSATNSNLLVGTISSGTGAYAALVGHTVTFSFTLSPAQTAVLPPIAVSQNVMLGPAVLVGSISVSP
ncbi:MAG TPA: hypothetical protein VNG12_06690 [Acidimicrobiales bacterium]|nr:hypothetical protein [Acidimicrobiales bacterium]